MEFPTAITRLLAVTEQVSICLKFKRDHSCKRGQGKAMLIWLFKLGSANLMFLLGMTCLLYGNGFARFATV